MLITLVDGLLILYASFYLTIFFIPIFKISNISGPTFGFLFLISLRYIIDKNRFLDNSLFRIIKKISRSSDIKLLSASILIIFMFITSLSIARHISFSSGASDLGIFDQAIWNTAQGKILFSSLKGNMNLLGDHFEPILLFIAPLYKVWPNVLVLFLLQSFLLASAIIPLYLIAKVRLNSRLMIFAFIISYILSKPMRGVGLSDFHPECFILVFIFWAYYFLLKKRNFLFFVAVLLLLLCKEDISFVISGFGIFTLFFQRRFKLGIVLLIGGIMAWILETRFIIPCFNPLGKYSYMDRLPFGLTYKDNLKAILENPLILKDLLLQKEKIIYCLKLFGPVGFLSLFSPVHYILIAVPLFKNLLPASGNFSGFYDITSHYTAGIIPFIYISAIYGAGWLIDRVHLKRVVVLVSYLIVLSSLFFYAKTDGYKFSRFITGIRNNNSFQKISYLRAIPKNASIATNFNLVPHLSHRRYIFEWNPRSHLSQITEYLVIDLSLLEYLTQTDLSKMETYFQEIRGKGYKKVFSGSDGEFLIYHNPAIDKTLVEKISLTEST